MITVEFMTVDVFTGSQFSGNQLAIIPDARRLNATQMRRIASEFNYSETTFLLLPDAPQHTARVRIFTPMEEIPFAGHPNVGTAYAVARIGKIFERRVEKSMIFEEGAGLVAAQPIYEGAALTGAQFDVPQKLRLIYDIDPQIIADCVLLPRNEIALGVHWPIMGSIGLPFAIAEVSSVAALGRAKPNLALFADADARYPARDSRFSLFLYTRIGIDPVRLRARMFAPLSNILEDPATGSAAGALAAFLSSMPSTPDGTHSVQIEQGAEIGRPSLIGVNILKRSGVIERVSISGKCASVMRGVIEF